VSPQEIARNTNITPTVRCSQCKKESHLPDLLHEEPLPYPHNTVVEGFLLCPHCGLRTHSYYMPERLRFEQERLKQALEAYHAENRTGRDINKAYRRYRKLLEGYHKKYDEAQEKYRNLMRLEEEDETAATE